MRNSNENERSISTHVKTQATPIRFNGQPLSWPRAGGNRHFVVAAGQSPSSSAHWRGLGASINPAHKGLVTKRVLPSIERKSISSSDSMAGSASAKTCSACNTPFRWKSFGSSVSNSDNCLVKCNNTGYASLWSRRALAMKRGNGANASYWASGVSADKLARTYRTKARTQNSAVAQFLSGA